MKPLLVLGVGRSGTTFLMRLLAAHPAVIAQETYPLECRAFLLSIFPYDQIVRDPKLRGEASDFESGTSADIFRFYSSLAKAANKEPRYFAEKMPPWLDARKIISLHPDTRFLCLVRDPRDVLLSARAFDRKRGFRAFQERDGDTEETVVTKYANLFSRLLATAAEADAKIVRYEALAGENSWRAVGDIFSWLGIDAAEDTVRKVMEAAATAESGAHVTARSLQDSVARWKTEMPHPLIGLFSQRLGPILTGLGYETSKDS